MDTRIAKECKRLTWMIGINIAMNLIILGKLLLCKP